MYTGETCPACVLNLESWFFGSLLPDLSGHLLLPSQPSFPFLVLPSRTKTFLTFFALNLVFLLLLFWLISLWPLPLFLSLLSFFVIPVWAARTHTPFFLQQSTLFAQKALFVFSIFAPVLPLSSSPSALSSACSDWPRIGQPKAYLVSSFCFDLCVDLPFFTFFGLFFLSFPVCVYVFVRTRCVSVVWWPLLVFLKQQQSSEILNHAELTQTNFSCCFFFILFLPTTCVNN